MSSLTLRMQPLVVRALFNQPGLWQLFDELLGEAKQGASFSDRASVLAR